MRNWEETCAKCADGEIEPTYCEYYGEPNGCNSPTYHEHPPVGNAAAMQEALSYILNKIAELRERNPNVVQCVQDTIDWIENWASYALSKPSRNCDKYTTETDAKYAFLSYRNKFYESDYDLGDLKHNIDGITEEYAEWLFDPAKKGGAE